MKGSLSRGLALLTVVFHDAGILSPPNFAPEYQFKDITNIVGQVKVVFHKPEKRREHILTEHSTHDSTVCVGITTT